MSIEVFDDVYVNLQLDLNCETEPSPGNVNGDVSYRVGIGYEF